MRVVPGLFFLSVFLSPLAHAELIDEVNDRGELRIALEGNLAPFNFTKEGKLSGFEIELGEMLAQELDLQPSFIPTTADDMMQGVESDKYDIALNHIAVTPELKKQVDFSEPYSYSNAGTLAIPFQKGNPAFQGVLDRALERIKADGRLSVLSEKWFGVDTTKPPKP
ncbi:transporter substrate-binding domain-containing protein [Pseudomonas sp. NA-150]|uniref:transporter substrate-binding domain-containing protein n=1 Tax=Pseudomonas sp. NA-150 TaxID=3367525 RepID=UPI0037C99D6A